MATLFDAAYPGPADPHVDGCLFYCGGDTPHIWTDAQIAAAPGRYRLPCWVRSNPAAVDPEADAGQAIAWLTAHRWPKGKAIVLDLETAVDPNYVNVFGARLHAAGWLVWPYGSTSTLKSNPALDGYFESDPTGTAHIRVGDVATQYLYAQSYDLDVTDATAELEDLQAPSAPVLPPAPAQTIETIGDNVLLVNGTVDTDKDGNGWADFALGGKRPAGAPFGLNAQPGVAATRPDGDRYDHAQYATSIGAGPDHIRVTVTDGQPSARYGVRLPVG